MDPCRVAELGRQQGQGLGCKSCPVVRPWDDSLMPEVKWKVSWCSSQVAVSVRADMSQALREEVGVSKTRLWSEHGLAV